jgi:iron complex outermembrane receptor protein
VNLNYSFSNDIKFSSNFQSNYIDAFNTDSPSNQLIYVPRYQFHWDESFSYKKWNLNYGGDFTSFRYVSWDNKYYLPQYFLHQLGVSYLLNLKSLSVKTNFLVRNISNTQYQVIALRPMPGRNYEISLLIIYKK